MLSTKIKGGSDLSTNYVIRSTKNPKGGQTESKGGQKPPLAPPEINPELLFNSPHPGCQLQPYSPTEH